ncbi:hypothetical protein DUNSADRAFT_12784 [Dunaliella salina]|uniref:Encoded protein n=1 Tax=Dunaliella salina TaxID=3046 RepID=A0ABQ7GAI4_DUNSA|nr:hypothetical protein DUNSADRAFT_12784 [Dunaliella salina]|eukprot:KAF5831624.1 hypothetical protein DUNSADRAFT_12784 [Dunaliella salina]
MPAPKPAVAALRGTSRDSLADVAMAERVLTVFFSAQVRCLVEREGANQTRRRKSCEWDETSRFIYRSPSTPEFAVGMLSSKRLRDLQHPLHT